MSTPFEDQIKDAAHGAFEMLKDSLVAQSPSYVLTPEEEAQIAEEAIIRHIEHLKKHHVKQGTLDPFKFVCWLGGSLLDSLWRSEPERWGAAIDAILDTMEDILAKASKGRLRLPRDTRHLLRGLLMAEKQGESRHGIGMNGLYMSFHCCMLINPDTRSGAGWGRAG